VSLSSGAPLRLILHPQMEGRENMAVDEALLLRVGGGDNPPVVRLYGFAPPTLSLGRFQPIRAKLRLGELERDGITLVRRPTGGQAVLHDHELTYSVILGKEHIRPFSKREIYRFIAGLLLAGLKQLGIEGSLSQNRRGDLRQPDCFGVTGEYEIAGRQGRKLIGSAQFSTRTACLQHGAIPLDDSYRRLRVYLDTESGEDHLPPTSLGEELGRPVSFLEAREAFATALRSSLPVQPGVLEAPELELVQQLIRSKYSQDAWNLQY